MRDDAVSYVVRTNDLSKQVAGKNIIVRLNMQVRQGEIYGLIGSNGSGKTTLFKLLTGLWKPLSGEIELFGRRIGHRSYQHFQQVGCLIGTPRFYERMSGRENLELHCKYMGYYDERVVDEAIELLNLGGVAGKPVHTYSLGFTKKLGLARAIMLKPPLLIVDEPANGIDTIGIHMLRHVFRNLNQQYGMSIVISSHHMGELEQMADTVGILREGRLMKEASMTHIREAHTGYLEVRTSDCKKAVALLDTLLDITKYLVIGPNTIRIYESSLDSAMIVKTLVMHDVKIDEITHNSHTLEDFFIRMMEGKDRDDSSDET